MQILALNYAQTIVQITLTLLFILAAQAQIISITFSKHSAGEMKFKPSVNNNLSFAV